MTKNAGLVAILIIMCSDPAIGIGQIIENPSKPKAANAGRVVIPEEVLSISDQGTRDYYFKVPRDLTIAPDGSLVLLDQFQVLQFDKYGKFVRNLYRKGQGPDEMSNVVRGCLTTVKNIIVHADSPSRLIFFDYEGHYQKEIPLRDMAGPKFQPKVLLAFDGSFYLRAADWPTSNDGPKYMEVPHGFVALDASTLESRKLSSFPTISYVVSAGGGRETWLNEVTSFITAPLKRRYLVLSHTGEYLIKIYDPASDKVIREFRRDYERVKPEPIKRIDEIGNISIGGKRYALPEQRFQNDVKTILTRGNEIWAVTSTKDDSKGVLIDIFDERGVYQDCFFLKLPRSAVHYIGYPEHCALDGDFLWVVERDDDDICTIRKYRLAI
jgi:hypothetical protein